MLSKALFATGGAGFPFGDLRLLVVMGYSSLVALEPVMLRPISLLRLYMAKSLVWSAKCIM